MIEVEKQCFKCKEWKSPDEFYVHKEMADGRLGKCKECTKKDVLEHRNANIERIRTYDRERGKMPHRIAAQMERSKIYKRLNPECFAVASILNRAVRTRRIKKPRKCSRCGKSSRIYGHHEDYCKPLEVIWVCQACHKAIHKNNHVMTVRVNP